MRTTMQTPLITALTIWFLSACTSSELPTPSTDSSVGTGAIFTLVDSPVFTHDRDYYAYDAFLAQDAPRDWTEPIPYADGTIELTVDVQSIPDTNAFPFFHTVIFKRCLTDGTCGSKAGVVRASVKITQLGVNVGGGKVTQMEKVGWTEADRPAWDWSKAFSSVNGDIIQQNGTVFPVQVKVKVVLRTP
jgi:hypothetical protein